MERIEFGMMIMKDEKAWGTIDVDGSATITGWVNPCVAYFYDSEYVEKITDIVPKGDNTEEILTGKMVRVKRTTKIEIV